MRASTSSSWLQYTRPQERASLRLFCLPYAGGSASIFRTWADVLPVGIAVCPLQLPGRENRLLEEPISSMSALVEALGRGLEPFLHMPFAIFGHSMGALIGFELAHYIRRRYGYVPLHFFASGCRAPQVPDPDPPIHQLPDALLVEELRQFRGTPEEVLQHHELVQLLLPTLRADFALCETYQYEPVELLPCPISVFGGMQDKEVAQSDLLAWEEQTESSFKLRLFAGNHFFINSARNLLLQALAQDVLRSLQRSAEQTS